MRASSLLKPPEPKPPPKGVSHQGKNPRGARARWMPLLRANWENCNEKYWIATPDYRYRFRADELRRMFQLVTSQEKARLLGEYDRLGNRMKVANLLRTPFFLADLLIGPEGKNGFPRRFNARKTFERVQEKLLKEIGRRISTAQGRKRMSPDELERLVKICRESIGVIDQLEEANDSGVSILRLSSRG